VTTGQIICLVLSGAAIFLGLAFSFLGLLPQGVPIFYFGLVVAPGIALRRLPWLQGALILSAGTYAVTWVATFTSGIGEAVNDDQFLDHVYKTSFVWSGATTLLAFGIAAVIEVGRRRRNPVLSAGGAGRPAAPTGTGRG
jgi:hypothetical protein